MDGSYWARRNAEGPYPLRRGAWYRVADFEPNEILVDVQWMAVSVPRSFIQIVEQRPPLRWTVVPRPRDAVRIPERWGDKYGVCPNCSNRASLQGSPEEMTCDKCGGLFVVAWEEKYLQQA
jgi:hypothetical protein